MADWKKVTTTAEIPQGSFKGFEVGFDRILIAHVGDEFYCLADECTHDGEPISTGFLKRNELICSRHGARFDVRTGEVTRAPAIVPLDKYEIKVEGGDIYVKLED
jgi:3-phenylpropionate/trans-cinnamate dioxygenase ferredoxin subunit